MSSRDSHGQSQSRPEGRESESSQGSNMTATHLPPVGSHNFALPQIHYRNYGQPSSPPLHSRAPYQDDGYDQFQHSQASHDSRRSSNDPHRLHTSSGRVEWPAPPSGTLPSGQSAGMHIHVQYSSQERMQNFPTTFVAPSMPDSRALSNHGRQSGQNYDPARDSITSSSSTQEPSSHPSPSSSSSRGSEAPSAAAGASYNAHGALPRLESDHGYLPPTPFDPTRYRLIIRQQPLRARACGHGERDRRVIDPPPILQLSLADFDPESQEDRSLLGGQYNIVQCRLFTAASKDSPINEGQDVTEIPDPNQSGKMVRRLMGTLSVNPFVGTDPDIPKEAPESVRNRMASFYIFGDISCRQNGLFRLRFDLVRVDVNSLLHGVRTGIAASAISDVFEVSSAKEFPGMTGSSRLTKGLREQGATVPVKKGAENRVRDRARRSTNNNDPGGSDHEPDDERTTESTTQAGGPIATDGSIHGALKHADD